MKNENLRPLLRMYRLALAAPGCELPWAAILRQAAAAVAADAVLWVKANGGQPRLERWYGRLDPDPNTWPEATVADLVGPVIAHGAVRDLSEATGGHGLGALPAAAGMRSALAVPVRVAGHVGGVVVFLSRRRAAFAAVRRGLAREVAQVLALMVENDRVCQYLEATGGRAERERLAAELHDGVVQDLYGVQLALEDLTDRLGELRGAEPALAVVSRIGRSVEKAIADLRQTIADLNQRGELTQGLIPALRAALLQLGRATGIDARLAVSVSREPIDLPLAAKVQALRILHEALANVRKHAQATRVLARVEEFPTYYRFTVSDNGVGFDPAAVGEGHFGLQVMKERAASVDGMVTIDARPGRGATLTLSLPRP